MTTPRQRRKGRRFIPAAVLIVLFGIVSGAADKVAGSTTERVLADPHTGIAIDGYDPVAYFTDGMALQGRVDYEAGSDGVIWRFRNEGNRAAFLAHPEVYAPQFGGYDPVSAADGKAVAGHPLTWRIMGARLYFFADVEARAAFLADPAAVLARAARAWPGIRARLAR